MDKHANIDRRDALKGIGMGVAACVLCRFASDAHAAGKDPRPRGTCEDWADKVGDGICDVSQQEEKPCMLEKCPGNTLYAARKNFKKNGAPKGVCGLWMDPEKAGYCMMSIVDDKPCGYKRCPAHRKHKA